MPFAANKTKIVCTIGPASENEDTLIRMIEAGMNVVRLNFSHGDFASHAQMIKKIRSAAKQTGRRIAMMADLPGPKIRIGDLETEPIELEPGATFALTTQEIIGDQHRASVSFKKLTRTVKSGDRLFLNDGIIQLQADEISDDTVRCQVIVGGELRSRKGLNLPGINLGISAFTDFDHACLEFAMSQGVDAVSQSFVESGQDIDAVRDAAQKMGHAPFIIAKIERANALRNMDDILAAANGIMIARGDLGVEIPIEDIAVVQKKLMRLANLKGKPVITATHMLESMTSSKRPTRAEATDVANAILDGTDCVMLSGESAMGKYPVDSVRMLAKIATASEPHRPAFPLQEALNAAMDEEDPRLQDLIALSVEATLNRITPPTVIVPTHSGSTARSIARFKLPVWITAVSSLPASCQNLMFSYGVHPVHEPDHPDNWRAWAREWLNIHKEKGHLVVLTEGPSSKHPHRNNRMEIIDLRRK